MLPSNMMFSYSFHIINTLRTGLLNCLNARSRGLTFRHRAPRLLSVNQKQQGLDVCLDLKENAANDSSFLSNVIMGDETWVYAYDPKTKTHSSQWKSTGSPRPKKAGQVRSNIKSMLICFFD